MSNEAEDLRRRLAPAQLELLKRASVASAEEGVALFLVGGTVRDILSHTLPGDLDLVAEGGPPDFASTLAAQLDGEVAARSQFGTAKLRIGETTFDLAAARKEVYARPGALPDVSAGSMDDDLARRDFSVNAIAVSLGETTWGELLDPFQGKADLRRRVVRVLHTNSFVDDATRILRAVRYSQRLGFHLEEETERLIRRDVHYLDSISGHRVRNELERIFREPGVASVLEAAQDLGVLEAVHPALSLDPKMPSRLRLLRSESEAEEELRLLAALVFSAPAEELSSVIDRLNMDGRWARVVRDVGGTKADLPRLGAQRLRRSEVYTLLRHRHPTAIEGCAVATEEPLVRERLELYLTDLRHVKTALRGGDLLALGVPEGPMVGELLEKVLMARLEGLLSTREDEESLVRRSLGESSGA